MRFSSVISGSTLPRQGALTSTRLVSAILIASTASQGLLALIHTHIHSVSATTVGGAEFVIYLACVWVLAKHIRLEFVTITVLVLAYLVLLSIFRTEIELKGFRDVIIPLLFYWLGRQVGNMHYADRILKVLVVVVLLFGFFELFFLDGYTYLLNIFSYYMSTGTIALPINFNTGSLLNLNGLRPEGIGRTILPDLLGSHRISSIFLEPVSLGNFAVTVAAWGLSKGREEYKQALFFVVAAIILISLSDSRFGLGAVALLMVMKLVAAHRFNGALIFLPLISILSLILIGFYFHGPITDDTMGRLSWTGITLLEFNIAKIFGIAGIDNPYADMGYAYLLSRWGVLLCITLWGALWMIRMQDEQGQRFRAYVVLYITLILAISGTSFFALKTAGLLWFLMGSCAHRNDSKTLNTQGFASRLNAAGREPNSAH